ncbi:DNA polymerase III subunit epsilon [Pantoea sp. Mhis]|uniref:DNA polymerase III subunit epsilon n=1 Tax=Pantoea sp. Mhis TaxID=2576759 RepID=UPI00351B09C9
MHNNDRQIILDTETTGMNMSGVSYEGHRIIEIGAVEIINRYFTGKNFHVYLNPDRLVDTNAFKVHGISDKFLADKPHFADIADDFFQYIQGAELVIHNASFDISFINQEFKMINHPIIKVENCCQITDSLALARKMFIGKRNSLDALCKRFKIDNKRILHGALLDAELLAKVYLAMTGGQTMLALTTENDKIKSDTDKHIHYSITKSISRLRVISANYEEIIAHENYLNLIEKKEGKCLWRIP